MRLLPKKWQGCQLLFYAVSFASLGAERGVHVRDLIQDTKNARGAIAVKDKWLPWFVTYDTTDKNNDYEFTDCRRTNVFIRSDHLKF